MTVDASIVIRTYNEERWLPEVLAGIARQQAPGIEYEVVLVDSGSTDRTRAVAEGFGARVIDIRKDEFSFGRSLNRGCSAARGRWLVFVSGHCIPKEADWLARLIQPLADGMCAYVYGRQESREGVSKFSEARLFEKYFPEHDAVPQEGFFCNNANAALAADVWARCPFDEEATGLEDMILAKELVRSGHKIGYVAQASVIHLHEEGWRQVRNRYEREAIALQSIMPEVQVSFGDFIRYTLAGILLDSSHALSRRVFWREAKGIFLFRFMQYWGSYRGNHEHRRLSQARKERYFYPRPS